MRNIITLLTLVFTITSSSLCAQTICFEAEDFQFKNDWIVRKQSEQTCLYTENEKRNAFTVININEAAEYVIWVSAYDAGPNDTAERLFLVGIDEIFLEKPAGKHGKDGFKWQKLGALNISKGEHTLSLKRLNRHPRVDAVLLTADKNFDPNKTSSDRSMRLKIKAKPVIKNIVTESSFPALSDAKNFQAAKTVSIKNAKQCVSYTQVKDSAGKVFYRRSAQVFAANATLDFPEFSDEALYIITSPKPNYEGFLHYTRWREAKFKCHIEVAGKEIKIDMPTENPYSVGEAKLLYLSDVKKISEDTLSLDYGDGVLATLKLLPSGLLKMDVNVEVQAQGYYSFAFLGFDKKSRNAFENAFLPTFYQGRRLMDSPKMVEDRMTSQPLSLVESKSAKGQMFVQALVADIDIIPFEWSHENHSYYGLSLASPDNKLQTAIFRPVLGTADSKKKSGEKLSASFYIMNIVGDFTDAFELANVEIFKTNNMREAYKTSLSTAAANIATLMKNESAGGWSAKDKGRWNIETQHSATQSSPLSELSVAILTEDEDYYKQIALPSLEFIISRKHHHFVYKPFVSGGWSHQGLRQLNVPNVEVSKDTFAAFNKLMGGGNPWLAEFYKNIKDPKSTSKMATWQTLLGIYLAEPSDELLNLIKQKCDIWLENEFGHKPSRDVNMEAFINSGLYPAWWHLVDLYEISAEKKYMDYAKLGAFYSLSSLWAFPKTPSGEVTINKGNFVQGRREDFWKDGEKFRLGSETNDAAIKMLAELKPNRLYRYLYAMPEKQIEASAVARVGLGIEQHSTYKRFDSGNYHNILMPGWAPEMLKVYQYTQNEIIKNFSRHSIVGRYSNYPGYYYKDFTDVGHNADYPYKGPDITSIYFHHIPCAFAHTFDYLMTQIEVASNNGIKFPHLRQRGYVWFVDRIFGLAGKVFFDNEARPLIDADAVQADSPKISTLLARGKDALWVIALNDGAKDTVASLAFNSTARTMKSVNAQAKIDCYDASGKKLDLQVDFFAQNKVPIPAQSLVALRLPAAEYNPNFSATPIKGQAHISMRVSEKFGDLHFFRIRSPFGKDSIFAVLTGGIDAANTKLTLRLNAPIKQVLQKLESPYEFSIYPLPQDCDYEVEAILEENGKTIFTSGIQTLKM